MRRCVVWIQLERPLVLRLSLSPLPLFLLNACQQDMGFGKPGSSSSAFRAALITLGRVSSGRAPTKTTPSFER
jgi:hypothetical protein